MATDGPQYLDVGRSDAGATPELLKATEMVIDLLRGFSHREAISILVNAAAMATVDTHDTEASALDVPRRFRRDFERCIRLNFDTIKRENKNDQSRR